MMVPKIDKTCLLICLLLIPIALLPLSITIRSADHTDYTRIVFEGSHSFQFRTSQADTRLDVELDRVVQVSQDVVTVPRSTLISQVKHTESGGKSTFSVIMKDHYKVGRHFVLERPFRVVFDLVKSPRPAGSTNKQPVAAESERENPQIREEPLPLQSNQRKVIETICIDAGHGGTDLGAVGKSKLQEKDITLDVAKKLKRMVESKMGLRVLMTRERDAEVSLNSRVSIANNQKADMFISIHVNSSFRRAARGPETFFVSLKATDQESYELAQKENKSFEEIEKIAPSEDLKMILWNMAQTQYIRESSKLAEYIQAELNVLMHTINRGVKQAPFRVLMRAAMPAVLVEIAFLSNGSEEMKLKESAFLLQVAQALYDGVAKFIYHQNSRYR